MKWCKKCWTPDTRPRVTFNEDGVCNACQWAEEKKSIDWESRQEYFGQICRAYRGDGDKPDCIVPWSGGKDSIYVAYKMHTFNMRPLLVTVVPHMETEIGKWNRQEMCKMFDKLEINLDEQKYRSLAKKYFIEQGRPKHPWETAISAAIINQSVSLNLPFIIYGEEGEQEYGGSSEEKDRWKQPVSKEYLMKYYWQNNLDWTIPDDFSNIFFTQWSRFENWSPDTHAHFAVCKGMRTEPSLSTGTFTSTNQLSDELQDLHTYLMYVKFGFGRCSSDVNIAIREGLMTREEGLNLINKYDGKPVKPERFLDYFEMSRDEFVGVITKHANKELMYQIDDVTWKLKKEIEETRIWNELEKIITCTEQDIGC